MYGKGKVKILEEKTFKEFNIKATQLNPGSHKKVCVQCERCEETFLRERRKLHQLHACPTHIVRDDGIKLKWCNRCKTFLTYKAFSKNNARCDGFNSWCKTCASALHDQNRKSTGRETLEGWMKSFLSAKRSRCKKHGITCTVTAEELLEQWAHQDGLCYYSKVSLKFNENSLYTANLDRVNPSDGYTLNNVVWASKAVNNMKNCYSEDELISFLEAMVFTNVRLECKVEHPDARLPFRKRVTDAGHDVRSTTDVVIQPRTVVNIETGLRVSPPPGWYITVDGRSSLFKEGIIPFRGIIDGTYTGPLLISLYNSSDKPFKVNVGDRVAQLILHKVYNVDFIEVKEFSPEYNVRGDDGWGSSGRS